LAAFFFFSASSLGWAQTGSIWEPLEERLIQDGFDRTYIKSLFGRTSLRFSPDIMARKINALLATKLSVSKKRPRTKPQAMGKYLNPILIAGAYGYYREHRQDFEVIERKYDVPGDILTALLLVETKLGNQVGRYNALTILSNMALSKDFSLIEAHLDLENVSDEVKDWLMRRTGQKANWAYGELKSLITYARQNGHDPLEIPSSMYGAIGKCQFIPSSALAYGVDGSGDGIVDLFNTADALHSMANFIKKHGWEKDLDRKAQLKVIYRYNHSESYSLTIMAVADKLRKTNDFFGN